MSDNTIPTTLGSAIDAFLLAKESEGVSPRTLFAYRYALARFASWLTAQGITSPLELSPQRIRAYFAELHKHNYSVHTIHDYARPVKTLLRFWYFDGIVSTDVMARVKMPPIDKKVLPALTEDEVKHLLNACETERDRALVLFLLDTGCRASEVCALNISDVDTKTGAVQVEHAKGGKRRTVYLGGQARRALSHYLLFRDDPSGPLFPSSHDHTHLMPNGLLQVVRRLGAAAGIKCSCHAFRRSFALTCLRNGMDIRRLAALMGHSDLAVVRQYLAITEQDIAAAHAAYGPVDGLLGKGTPR